MSIATNGFIGCNGDIRRTEMKSLRWRSEAKG